MASEDQPIDDLAGAIVEGQTIDWASAESSSSEAERELIRQLRVVAGIAELHRALTHDLPTARSRPMTVDKGAARWGRLELLERIGSGCFGEVYRAWDGKLHREVALKIVSDAGGRAEGLGSTVLREARLLARVRHPNVVTVYDADEFGGRVGLWMEFIRGRNLEEIIREKKRFDSREATRIGIELCRALAAVHDAGLVHRDLKAQNVMQADGRLVLMDFGTGRELGESVSGDAAGTPLYLAPELFRGEQATVRTDVYSAGVLLFHLVTGTYPVLGATVREVGAAHERETRLGLASVAPAIERRLAAVIDRALRRDPSERFESAGAMLAELERVERAAEEQRRKRYWLVLAAVSSIAVASALIPLWRRQSGQDPPPSGRSGYFGAASEMRALDLPPYLLAGKPSADGRFLPYSDLKGNVALYEFATGASRVLTSAGDGGNKNYAMETIVSEDSRQVAYSWSEESCGCWQLRVVGVEGASERVLYGGKDLDEILPREWSSNGQQILGTRQGRAGETEIVFVSVRDGSVRSLETVAHAFWGLSLSPDGRYLAYAADPSGDGTDSDLYLAAADGSGKRTLAAGPMFDSHPMWTPEGGAVLFASRRTGGHGLWLQPVRDGRPDGPPRLLNKDMARFQPFTLTRVGSFFYYLANAVDVYTAPIDPLTGAVIGEPVNGAHSFLGSNISPDWSPDGRSLAYASWRALFGPRRHMLVVRSLETGLERELDLDVETIVDPRWSPDGKLIAISGKDRSAIFGLRLVDVSSGSIVASLLERRGEVGGLTDVAWSRDGTYVYVVRGLQGIWRIGAQTRTEEILYTAPGDSNLMRELRLSPDGVWLSFVLNLHFPKEAGGNEPVLCVLSTAGGPARHIFRVRIPDNLAVAGWTRDGRQVLVTRPAPPAPNEKRHAELWAVPVAGGPPRRLGVSMHALRDVRVSPDGTRIAFTSGFPDRALWVMEHFLPR